ncbi:unnamed protein product, partial [Aureobasidium vineae]
AATLLSFKLVTLRKHQVNSMTTQSAEYYESAHATYWTDVPYERTPLNLLDICVPKRQPEDPQQAVWLVYIHGGAWRDPMIDRKSLNAALDMILEDDQPHNVAGFVSLDYRLSPYPSHPTSPSSPDDDSRNVQHPEHLNDILAALFFLGTNTGEETRLKSGGTVRLPDTWSIMAGRYVLCGHSCGATLAMQATALLSNGPGAIRPPVALLGMEGIYDLAALVATHTHPAYREFIVINCLHDEVWEKGTELAKAVRAVTNQR